MHVMLDLETMGTSGNSALISIGAYAFDFVHEFRADFHEGVDLVSCERLGLSVEADTVSWWLKQDPQAITSLVELPKIDIHEALKRFGHFLSMVNIITEGEPLYVWGNGIDFDNKILRNACEKAKITLPKFKDMDFRTIKTMARQYTFPDVESFRKDGVLHNALSDAKTQAEYLMEVLKKWK